MAVHEAFVPGRMDVACGVGMEVMMPVLGGPPQNTTLGAALGKKREDELESASGRIGAMREITMVSGADGKNAQPIKCHSYGSGLPGDTGPDRRKTRKMGQNEWNGRWIYYVIIIGIAVG